jgi:hypothetical protein
LGTELNRLEVPRDWKREVNWMQWRSCRSVRKLDGYQLNTRDRGGALFQTSRSGVDRDERSGLPHEGSEQLRDMMSVSGEVIS